MKNNLRQIKLSNKGLFGPPRGPQLFALTFIAYIVHSTILGIISFYWLKEEDETGMWQFIKGVQYS